MTQDASLLERLVNLPPVPVATLIEVLERIAAGERDPILAGLIAVSEGGEVVTHPLVGSVVEQLNRRAGATCNAALVEALTGIWNAAVRAAVVARLRAAGLPPDDLLLRLGGLSPTLGLKDEDREWVRAWMANPTAQDAALVQQCLVRLLLALRGLAEARAHTLTQTAGTSGGQST
jgi:hypothetical protein